MQNENNYVALVILSGFLAMAFAFWKSSWINNQDQGTERMISIGSSIADGAMAFLKAEYRILSVFVITVAFNIFVTLNVVVTLNIVVTINIVFINNIAFNIANVVALNLIVLV